MLKEEKEQKKIPLEPETHKGYKSALDFSGRFCAFHSIFDCRLHAAFVKRLRAWRAGFTWRRAPRACRPLRKVYPSPSAAGGTAFALFSAKEQMTGQ